MSSFKWLRRTSSFQQPGSPRFKAILTPRVGEVGKRIAPGSISGVAASFYDNSGKLQRQLQRLQQQQRQQQHRLVGDVDNGG